MTNTFEELLNPLDSAKATVLQEIAALAKLHNIRFMLFGAYALEVHFYHAHNIEPGRTTEDVDISIQVPDWSAYNQFNAILQNQGFELRTPTHPEKLIHKTTGIEVDLLPFGEIAEDGRTIIWPTDGSPWSVIGLDDAYKASISLPLKKIDEGFYFIPIVPIPALVTLKLIAIKDRPEVRHKKDGADITFIISKYLDVGNRARLLSEPNTDIMSQTNEDLERASAMLLGRDMKELLSEDALQEVQAILKEETEGQGRNYTLSGMKAKLHGYPRAREILKSVLTGITS